MTTSTAEPPTMSWARDEMKPSLEAREPRGEAWFASLYDQTCHLVYHLARTLVRDHETAEDIVAEAYVRVWKAREKYSGQGPLLSWVMAITRNCAMDHLRDSRPKISLDLFDSIGDPRGPESSGPSITESDAEMIRRAIGRLREDQQQVIFLRFYQELPHDVVASKLGKSPAAIRQIQYRALVQLRKLLQDERRAE